MYENSGPFCPVKSFEKYVSKLNPNSSDFFQRPLNKATDNYQTWYVNIPVDNKTLSSFVSRFAH
jgi:hypothetical protein